MPTDLATQPSTGQQLLSAPSGVRFIYRCLDDMAARYQADDLLLVLDDPSVGRQVFRPGRRPLAGKDMLRLAMFGPQGLHSSRRLDGGEAAEIVSLCAVALQLDVLRHRSLTDPLTRMYNRWGFDEFLRRAVEHARRYGRDCTLALIDIDRFKDINDRLGHVAGDAVLRVFGIEIQRITRGADIAGRLGGDEFALVLPDTDPEGARVLIERLRESLGVHPPTARVSFSVGFATCPADGEFAGELYAAADTRLYADKRHRHAETA